MIQAQDHPVPGDGPTPWTHRRLNALAEKLGSASYLEIGVARADTIARVRVPHRVGVDPDPETPSLSQVDLHRVSSDVFFAMLDPRETFDLIYIDGLHTFEQSYRDFCNSLAHSHYRTVILLDDVWPSDVYSAIPFRDHALAARRAATGSASRAWHGDVYKTIAMIHDYHSCLAMGTIVGSGNPQTVIWHGPTARTKPAFDSPEGVARLDYFALQNMAGLFAFGTEADILAACFNALTEGGTPRSATSTPADV